MPSLFLRPAGAAGVAAGRLRARVGAAALLALAPQAGLAQSPTADAQLAQADGVVPEQILVQGQRLQDQGLKKTGESGELISA